MLTLQEAWNKEGTVWLEMFGCEDVREAFFVLNINNDEIDHIHVVDRYFKRYTFCPDQYNRVFRCWNKWPYIDERREKDWD